MNHHSDCVKMPATRNQRRGRTNSTTIRRGLPALFSICGALLALFFIALLPMFPASSAASKPAARRLGGALAAGSITVKLVGQFVPAASDTFTLTKQTFVGSTDCSTGGGMMTTVPNVNSGAGHTFNITAANSVILTAPQFSDGNGQLLGWTSPTGGNFTPIPNTNNTQICVQGFDDAAHTFTAQYSPGIQTLDSTCTTVKTLFNVGETVCIRVVGSAGTPGVPWRVLVAGGSPNECTFFGPLNVTAETQTLMVTLPSSNAQIPAACTIGMNTTDIRGRWRAVLQDQAVNTRGQKNFQVHDINNPIAELSLFKDLTDNQAYPPGGSAHYRISLQNDGPDAAANVVLTETVPANTTFLSWTQQSGPAFVLSGPTGGNVTATIASLPPNTSASFELAVQIGAGVPNNTQIDNTVSVTTSTPEFLMFNNTSSAPIIVSTNACQLVCPANMSVADMGAPGEVVNFSNPTTIGGGSCGSIICTPASGSTFPPGITTVSCLGVNQGFCTFTITVGTPCMLTCPMNVTGSNDANQCGAVVNYSAPTMSGSCGTVTCTPPANSFFPVGQTTVMCTPSSGPSCSFTVTISDTQPPTITCPSPISQNADPGGCTATVMFTATAADNCSPMNPTPTCMPPSGSTFQAGVTTVTCSASDMAGNSASCSFTVMVNDMTPPMITCPANLTVVAPQSCAGAAGSMVTFKAPTATDNCPGVSVVCTPASGSMFPPGTTTVVCTATDAATNTATCSFSVTLFTACLQDDSAAGKVVLFNPNTGDYRFCCNGTVVATGVGKVTKTGCQVTIQDNTTDRRVLIKADIGLQKGTASIQKPVNALLCSISDKNLSAASCMCQ